jgi:hypothetical protein
MKKSREVRHKIPGIETLYSSQDDTETHEHIYDENKERLLAFQFLYSNFFSRIHSGEVGDNTQKEQQNILK